MSKGPEIVYVDCETVGLDHRRHQPFEIALLKPDGTSTVIWIEIDLTTADQGALRVNDYYRRRKECFPKYGRDRKDAAWQIAEETSGKILAGFNVGFDEDMFRTLLRSEGVEPAWYYRVLDVTDFAAGALGWTEMWNSNKVAKALGIEIPEEGDLKRHTALYDAMLSKAVHEAALELTERSLYIDDLIDALEETLWEDRFLGRDISREAYKRAAERLAKKSLEHKLKNKE